MYFPSTQVKRVFFFWIYGFHGGSLLQKEPKTMYRERFSALSACVCSCDLPLWGFYQTLGCRRFWPVQTSSSVTFVWYQCWGLPRFKKYHRLLNSSCSKFFFRPTKSQHYIYHLFFMLMDCNGNFYEALFMFGSSWVIRFHTNLWGPCQLSPGSVIKAKWRPKKY